MLKNLYFLYIVQNHSSVVMFTYMLFMNTKRTQLRNINFIHMFQRDIEPMIRNIDPSPAFHESVAMFINCV